MSVTLMQTNAAADRSRLSAKSDSANLDFLRMNAVLLVVFFHLLTFFGKTHLGSLNLIPMGSLGVFLFFVHTSLVLMLSLERQQEKFSGRGMFPIFMLRRVFRIYPLSLLVVGMIVACKLPLGHLEPGRLSAAAISAKTLVSNLLLVQNLTNTNSILGPLWSLPYEMQMYLFLPALFLLARKVKSFWWLVALWFGSVVLALAHAKFGHMPDFVKYVPCFMPGIIAYRASSQVRAKFAFVGWPIFLFALYAAFMLEQGKDNGWVICLMTGLAIPLFAEMTNPVLRRVSNVVAKYSYGIYLVHYFSIWLAFMELHWLPMWAQWAAFVVSLALICFAFYHLVEAPMIQAGSAAVRCFVSRGEERRSARGASTVELPRITASKPEWAE
jgi:peptidoglycan/LPS O-acetylase OafA/YrhL